MCFIFSLIPATFWVTIGYFVLLTAVKAEGGVRKFGRALAVWLFIIALLFPLMGAFMTFSGLCPIDQFIQQMGAQ